MDDLTFFQKIERFFRRYVLLRLRNSLLLGSLFVSYTTYIKAVTGYTSGVILSVSDVFHACAHFSVIMGFISITVSAIIAPSDDKSGDVITKDSLKDITDLRLMYLEQKKIVHDDEMREQIMINIERDKQKYELSEKVCCDNESNVEKEQYVVQDVNVCDKSDKNVGKNGEQNVK